MTKRKRISAEQISDLEAIQYAAFIAWDQGPRKRRRMSKLEKRLFPSSSVEADNREMDQFHHACICRLLVLIKKLDKKSRSSEALAKN